jgi:hypothetical protein
MDSPVRLRLAGRLSLRFVLELFGTGWHGRHVTDRLMRLATAQANQSHIMRDPELQRRYATFAADVPEELRRPISLNALSLSLKTPFETVRRRAAVLQESGHLRLVPGGMIVPYSYTSGSHAQALACGLWTALRQLYWRLRDIGMFNDLPQRRLPYDPKDPPVRLAIRHAVDYVLRSMETMFLLTRDPVLTLVFLHLCAGNSDHLSDAEAGGDFEGPEGEVSEALRRPISALAMSLRIGAAYETTRRYLTKLETMGLCRREPLGYLVPVQVLTTKEGLWCRKVNLASLERLFAALDEHGIIRQWNEERDAAAAAEPLEADGFFHSQGERS